MEHDLNCVRYDLALSYAREKLRYALEHGCPVHLYPEDKQHLNEMAYLEEQFCMAFSEYTDIGEDEDLINTLKIRL